MDIFLVLLLLNTLVAKAAILQLNTVDFDFKSESDKFLNLIKAKENFSGTLELINEHLDVQPEVSSEFFTGRVKEFKIITEILSKQEKLYHEDFYKNPQIQRFVNILAGTIEKYENYFSVESYDSLIKTLVACGITENHLKLKSALYKLFPKFDMVQKLILLKTYKKFVNLETLMIIYQINSDLFLHPDRVAKFFNEYIRLFFDLLPPGEEYISCYPIFSLFIFASKTKSVLSDESYGYLFMSLLRVQKFEDEFIFESFESFIESFVSILNIIKPNSTASRLAADLILNEKIVCMLDSSSFNENYMKIVFVFIGKNDLYFSEMLSNLPENVSSLLNNYLETLQIVKKVEKILSNLLILKEHSNELEFKLGLNSIINIRKICQEHPELIKFIPNFDFTFKKIQQTIATQIIFKNPSHDFFPISLEIIIHASFIYFDLLPKYRKVASANMSYCIGHLLLRAEASGEYPIEFVENVLPNLDEIIKLAVIYNTIFTYPLELIDLLAYIKFINLHPTPSFVQSNSSQLYIIFIESNGLKENGKEYKYVNNLDITDKIEILKLCFIYFLNQYNEKENSVEIDILHLREYYHYLKKSNYLSKSEELIIFNIINNINI